MTVDALGGITRKRYDADGRMIAYIDSLGNTTSYGHRETGTEKRGHRETAEKRAEKRGRETGTS